MRKLRPEPVLNIEVSPVPVPSLGLPRTMYTSCYAAAAQLKQRSQDHALGKIGLGKITSVIWSNLPAQTVSSQSTWHMIACRWFLNISTVEGSRMPL